MSSDEDTNRDDMCNLLNENRPLHSNLVSVKDLTGVDHIAARNKDARIKL